MGAKIAVKVEGGKLLRMELELAGERIKSLKISGDFFIHPEDSLQIIEKALYATSPDADMVKVADNLKELAASQGIQMIGITPGAISATFKEAVKRAKEMEVASNQARDAQARTEPKQD